MPTRQIGDFLPLVTPYARTCPNIVAIQMIRLAAIDWCERTRCWRHVANVAVDETPEAVVAPDYAVIHEIETAWWNDDIELEPQQFSEMEPDALDGVVTGQPRYITQAAPGAVRVVPFEAGTLRLTMFLKPQSGPDYGTDPDDATARLHEKQNVLPEHVFKQDAHHIAKGALGQILAIPGMEWTDPNEAARYRIEFEMASDRKFRAAIRGQQRATLRTKAHWI